MAVDAWIEIREGAQAGSVHRLGDEPVMIGRGPDAHLRLDPYKDLSVSGRHALLVPSSDGWVVRDLGSTNGTWVNDQRLDADQPLRDGDRIRLGPGGPILVFCTGDPGTVRVPAATKPTRKWMAVVPLLAVAAASVVLLAVVAYVEGRRATKEEWARERAVLEARMDSVLAVAQAQAVAMKARSDSLVRTRTSDVHSLELRVSGLLDALQTSEAEVHSLRESLRETEEGDLDDKEVARLRQRLQTVSVALERQQLAASLDFETIERVTRPGVAQIYVETADGVVTGTAFGVSPSGVLMTNRHVVRGPDGNTQPGRIGVQFSDSRQVWPAHIVAVSSQADLALVQAERIEGDIPTVLGFNAHADTLGSGAPVAILGFPLGGRPPEGGAGVVRPLLTAGVISGNRGDLVALQGYGEEGASGSPVLDRDAHVIGILVGARQDGAERTLLAIPAREAIRLLERDRP